MAKRPFRFRVGDRVTVKAGSIFAGGAGRCGQRAHKSVWPYYDWIVEFDEHPRGRRARRSWEPYLDEQLERYSVPADARPVAVGALYHPRRGGHG